MSFRFGELFPDKSTLRLLADRNENGAGRNGEILRRPLLEDVRSAYQKLSKRFVSDHISISLKEHRTPAMHTFSGKETFLHKVTMHLDLKDFLNEMHGRPFKKLAGKAQKKFKAEAYFRIREGLNFLQ